MAATGNHVTLRGNTFAYSEEGDGPLAIYAHGLTSSRANVQATGVMSLGPLADAGFHAIAYDARGHGESSGTPDPSVYEWTHLADDFLAIADHFSPTAPVCAIGTSMGTGTILHALLRAPERFDRLVLTAPPTAWETRARQAGFYGTLADTAEAQDEATFLVAIGANPLPSIFADVPEFQTPPSIDYALLPSVFRGAGRSDLPDHEALRGVRRPTLILAWAIDPGHPVSTSEKLAELIPGSELHVSQTYADILTWADRAARFLSE